MPPISTATLRFFKATIPFTYWIEMLAALRAAFVKSSISLRQELVEVLPASSATGVDPERRPLLPARPAACSSSPMAWLSLATIARRRPARAPDGRSRSSARCPESPPPRRSAHSGKSCRRSLSGHRQRERACRRAPARATAPIGEIAYCTRPATISVERLRRPLERDVLCLDADGVVEHRGAKCMKLPTPAERKLSSFGFALASATNSLSVFTPERRRHQHPVRRRRRHRNRCERVQCIVRQLEN